MNKSLVAVVCVGQAILHNKNVDAFMDFFYDPATACEMPISQYVDGPQCCVFLMVHVVHTLVRDSGA